MEKKKRGGQIGNVKTPWLPERIDLLKKLYPKTDNAVLAKMFNVSERAIRSAAVTFDVKKSDRYWSEEDCKWLVDHWGAIGVGMTEIMAHFPAKTKWAIINKYRSLTGKRVDNGKKA